MTIDKNEYLNKTFMSKKYGEYMIIDSERSINCTMVTIQFKNSGAIIKTTLSNALNCKVRDPLYGLSFNKIYYSDNYGPYKVLNVIKGKSNVQTRATVQFLNTGTIIENFLSHVSNGDICDPNAPYKIPLDTSVLSEEEKSKKLLRLANNMYRNMYRRCNDKNIMYYCYYGEIGIRIYDRWLDKNNFLEDLPHIPQYEKWCRFPTLYQLDKDYKQLNVPKQERIYSLETCILLYYKDNTNIRCIEQRRDYPELYSSKYFGVVKETNSTFSASITMNGQSIYLGTFDDEIVAANVFNYWHEKFHNYEIIPLFNNVPYISPEQFILHNTRPKTICVKI